MTVAVRERVVPLARRAGRSAARRAMARWAWRMFLREWRRQAVILVLLTVAVAATVFGLGVVSNAAQLGPDPTFGTANTIITLPGTDPQLASDLTTIRARFGVVEEIDHDNIAVPGSVSTIDLRAQDPYGPFARVTLRLDSGRYPSGPGEVALTSSVASLLGAHLGSTWSAGGRDLRVVGIVENPLDLLDQFALVPPGHAGVPGQSGADQVSVLLDTSQGAIQTFNLPSGTGMNASSRSTGGQEAAAAVVLLMATLGLIFVGLMAVAGFAVVAQRRQRSLGMLGSLGATSRHVRTVMLANGAAVGATSAVVGAAAGLGAWLLLAPTLQSVVSHRIDRFSLPWWAIGAAMFLTLLTALGAAWWPARAAARMSVIAALSGRPPRPQPARRFAASGAVLLAGGIVLLAFADGRRAGFIIGGTVVTVIGLLLLSPLAIRALATLGGRSRIAVRLALRDLVRFQARSGAALGAITLAVGIASTIAVSAAVAETPTGPGNLASSQLMVYVAQAGGISQIPPLDAQQQQVLEAGINRLAASIHARSVLPLEQAYNSVSQISPAQPGGPGGGQPAGYATATMSKITLTGQGEEITQPLALYVATPQVLAYYGISAAGIDPAADLITSRPAIAGEQIFAPTYAGPQGPGGPGPATQGPEPQGAGSHVQRAEGQAAPPGRPSDRTTTPRIQTVSQLPGYTSDPDILLTPHAMQSLGLQAIPAAWLIQAKSPLTPAQIATARSAAASAGFYIETRTPQKSLAPLMNWSTAGGILLALGVLAMTVGLIRSESANDLRTLTATGATGRTRRAVTGATAAALAALGALMGTAGAYAALLAWHRSDLSKLDHVPVANLAVILAGLPLLAAAGGWLLAGRAPAAISRRPIE